MASKRRKWCKSRELSSHVLLFMLMHFMMLQALNRTKAVKQLQIQLLLHDN